MILADKIILQRKKNGWSQEELANKIGVSRQSVSKWEGAQSVPDLNKILTLADIFGVSTDYLLKDDIEDTDLPITAEIADDLEGFHTRRVSIAEANEFLAVNKRSAGRIATGVLMIIVCAVPLILFSSFQEAGIWQVSENVSTVLGLIPLFGMIAAAIALFMLEASRLKKFEFLDKEVIDTEYGIDGMVKEIREDYRQHYTLCMIIGIVLLVLSPVIVVLGMLSDRELWQVIAACFMLVDIAVGVYLLVKVNVIWKGYKKLLQEEEFSAASKRKDNKLKETVSGVFWLITLAVYLLINFLNNDWDKTWIVWPIAGLVFAIIMIIVSNTEKNE